MAENITDLTDDEEPDPKGKKKKPPKEKKEKKAKAPKAPKAPKEKKAKKEKPPKVPKGEREKSGGLKLKLIIILIIIVLIVAFCAAVYLNFFGLGDMVLNPVSDWLLSVVVWLNPEFSSVQKELVSMSDARQEELDAFEQELNTREEELERREEDANNRERQIDRRSTSLDRREEQLDQRYEETTPLFRRVLTEQELADIQSLSRTYSQMSPETAADILTELYEPRDVASILYYMTERNAAAILAVMEVEYAVTITEILLG